MKKYLPHIIVGLIVVSLIAGIYFPLGYIGFYGHEPRSRFYIALDQGALFWGTLTATFAFMTIGLLKAEKYVACLALAFLLAISGMVLYMSLSDLKPTHIDIAIYENAKHENLIIQYFETGITGNPKSRLIKTSNMSSAIREYEEIHNALVLDTLKLYNSDFGERIPKVYIAEQDTFYLKKVQNPWKNNISQHNL